MSPTHPHPHPRSSVEESLPLWSLALCWQFWKSSCFSRICTLVMAVFPITYIHSNLSCLRMESGLSLEKSELKEKKKGKFPTISYPTGLSPKQGLSIALREYNSQIACDRQTEKRAVNQQTANSQLCLQPGESWQASVYPQWAPFQMPCLSWPWTWAGSQLAHFSLSRLTKVKRRG